MKKFILLVFTTVILASGLHANANYEENQKSLQEIAETLTKVEGATPAQWRITWARDASTQAIISWTTAEAGSTHTLYYGTTKQDDVANYEFKQECQHNGTYTQYKPSAVAEAGTKKQKQPAPAEELPDAYYHHATITNLKPSTTYYFVLKSDDATSKQLYFITAPETGIGFSVIHGGDSRSGHLSRCHVNMMIADMVAKDKSILAFIHGGDYIQNGGLWGQWRLWLSQHELTTASDGRVLPILPARGNHDGGPLYKEIFNVPTDQPDWFTTTLGKDVAVVTLDTNVPGGGDQVEWLDKELKRLRPQTTWLLTNYHKPLYPAVKQPSSYTKIFAPVFDTYNVDLACESDGHCIKRTVPIRAGKEDPTGVTYIGEGGLGVAQRQPKGDRWYLEGGIVGRDSHVTRLDFADETLRIRTILLDGSVFDDHSLKVRK